MSELPAFLSPDPGVNSGFMAAEITAAALAAENKQRAAPASIDSLTTCANQEDHVSMATHAARRLAEMNDNLGKILAIEWLAAAQGIGFRAPLKTGARLASAVARLRAVVPPLEEDRYMAPDIEAAVDLARARRPRRSRRAGRDAGLVNARPAPERPAPERSGPSRTDIAALADRLRAGETRALARALTLADIGGEEARASCCRRWRRTGGRRRSSA